MIYFKIDKLAYRQADRQKDRLTDRHTADRQTEGETYKLTD